MLPDKCHVSIGGYHFLLDEAIDHSANPEGGSLFRPHYKHYWSQLMQDRAPIIVGAPNSRDLRPERLIWSFNDWVGGEGNRTYQPDDPYVYDFSYGVNPRIRGQVTGRPARTLTTVTSNDQRDRGAMCIGNSALWLGQSQSIHYSTTGTSWVTQTSNCSTATSNRITAVAGDGEYFYYATWHSGTSGTRDLLAASTSAAGTSVVATRTNSPPYAGLATMNGRLYGWTGRKLHELDVFQSFPLGAINTYWRKVGDSGVDPVSTNVFGTSWWANCVAAETSVFCFYSTDAQSTVFEFQMDGGFAPIWTCPYGLTIKSMRYVNGVVYLAGHWGGDSNVFGRGIIYAIPLDTRKPVFVDWVRKQNNLNLEMQEMGASYGSQMLVAAARTGRIFIYDADMDGLSCLDDIATVDGGIHGLEAAAPRIPATDAISFTENSDRIADMLTFGTKRVVALFNPSATVAGSTVNVLSYDDDEPTNRQAGTATNSAVTKLETGDYDFDMPFDQKILLGFDVLFKPLTTGQSFEIDYSLDGGTYTTTTAITSASSDATKGRTYISISTSASNATQKFGRMRYKVTLTGTSGYQPPVIYNITSECMLASYDELWDLVLRLKDEKAGTRMSTHLVKGSTMRDFLFTAASTKNVLAFVDGYVYTDPGHSKASVDVVIDSIEDIAIRHGEGSCKITLRKVPN